MSISLVKKSLDLADVKVKVTNRTEESYKRKIKFKTPKKKQLDEKKNAALIVQKVREKSKADSKVDKVEVNVQKLLNLSRTNIIHRKLGTKLLDKVNKKKKECDKVEENKTAFTEEDFAKFEKEYFVN